MRIRSLITVGNALASAIAIAAAGYIATTEWRQWSDAGDAKSLLEVAGSAAGLSEKIALERGVYNQLLMAKTPPTDKEVAKLAETRTASDDATAAVRAALAALPIAMQDDVGNSLAVALSNLQALRRDAETEIARPSEGRSPDASAKLQDGSAAVLAAVSRIGVRVEAHVAGLAPDLARHARLISLAMSLRGEAGTRSAVLATYVGTREVLNPERIAAVYEANGRIYQAWRYLERTLSEAELSPSLAAAVEAAKKEFVEEGRATYARVFEAARLGTDPGMTIAEWRPWTTKALQSILGIRDAALVEGKDAAASMIRSAKLSFAVSICAMFAVILASFGLSVLLSRRVVKPLDSMTDAIRNVAGGSYHVTVPSLTSQDEIGDIARAVEVLRHNSLAMEQLRKEQAAAQAEREERQRKIVEAVRSFETVINHVVEQVSSASSQLEGAATSLTKTAETTQTLSGMVASASEQTSANVQGVAAASEELASTVSEISRQVQQSSSIASQAVEQAAKTNERVQDLSQSAERIGNVVGLINSIAGQTNLLALNATIEAARAGEAGKGFAVVAQEVKALADQTGKATSEIAQQISAMQGATGEAVSAIREITGTIAKMSEISSAIAAAVEEQGATTQEISRNVMEAAKGTSEVAGSITDVSRGATETGSASSQVLASAKQLSSESGNLRREVDRFLSTVRAA